MIGNCIAGVSALDSRVNAYKAYINEMHAIIKQLAGRGQIILITSSDLEELAQVCDRSLIFVQGTVTGELERDQLSEYRLLEAINTGPIEAATAS